MAEKRIIMTVTNNLESDQRVHRVASYFHENGWQVTVVGSQNQPCHDYQQAYGTKRLPVWFKKGPLFYAEINLRLFFYLLSHTSDRIWSNDTDTILAGFLASKLKRKRFTVDLHELFPEVPEVAQRPFVKGCWTQLENWILPRVKECYTVCQSIADYYHQRYGIDVKVLRNVPFKRNYSGKSDKLNFDGKRIILYQGAVNEGRGIEWIMDAMPYVENAVFVVIGKGDLYDTLREKCEKDGLSDRVKFLGHIPFAELSDYTNASDLGVCLLKEKGLSYYYALPNRVFDFMQAHVPLLATDFPEIARVLNSAGTGRVIHEYEPEKLAAVINEMLGAPIDHDLFYRASEQYNWELEREVIDLHD